jgi:hypothetical protein
MAGVQVFVFKRPDRDRGQGAILSGSGQGRKKGSGKDNDSHRIGRSGYRVGGHDLGKTSGDETAGGQERKRSAGKFKNK